MTTKSKKLLLENINISDFNNQIYNILKECQDEVKYRINEHFEYPKSIQRILLQNHAQFQHVEKLFLQSSIDLTNFFPLIPSNKIYEKMMESVVFRPLNNDVSEIFTQLKTLNFKLMFSLAKITFNNIKTVNISDFHRKMNEIFHMDINSWEQLESISSASCFYVLDLVVNNINGLEIYISETDITAELNSTKNVFCLYNCFNKITADGIRNIQQQFLNTNDEILLENIPFISSGVKSEYNIFSYIILDCRTKKNALSGYNLRKNFLKNFYTLFHKPTVNFMNNRKHSVIFNNLYTFLNTFNLFLNIKINPEDRFRFLLAGSVIKSAYNVRDCADVDFFVLDHESNIEKYSKYRPNVSISGIFDDFGKTYYGNEEYYFPMIPEMYEKQKELKAKKTDSIEPLTILNNFPKFSVSGLKAGRYIDIFSSECKKIGFEIENLDELVFNPDMRVYFMGCPLINLKIEMVRDNIKDIDLKRMSRKQIHDLHYLKINYFSLFSRNDVDEFGLNRFTETKEKMVKNKINIGLNCYHKPLISDEKVGFDLVIRRIPLYLENMANILINESPLLISRDNETYEADSRLTYQKPLLSSLPAIMLTPSERKIEVLYYFEVSSKGEIKIYINTVEESTDVSFFKDICITGNLKVEINELTKKILIGIGGNKMTKIFQQLGTQEKKYKTMLVNFMKNLIQLHKMIDCHTKEKITIDFLK